MCAPAWPSSRPLAGGQNVVPSPGLALTPGDGLLVIADEQSAIDEAAKQLGRLEPGRLVKDRASLDYVRIFVSKANLIGVPLARLPLPAVTVRGAWVTVRVPVA